MSMKEKLIKVVYSLLEMLPDTFANKIKMIGNIAVHNWKMESFCWFDIRKIMEESQARTLFDPDDMMTSLVLHHQYLLGAMYIAPEFKNSFFYYHRKEFYFPFEGNIKAIELEERKFKKKYGLCDVGPEVYFYNHGLYFLDEQHRKLIEGNVIIDAGAYQGESIIALLKYKPLRIIAFELSPRNYKAMENNLQRNGIPEECYTLVQEGLGFVEEDIFINDIGGANSSRDNQGELKCHITTVDNYVRHNPIKIGMLKADIEGAGLDFIKGAIDTIRRDRPIISIAVYHCADEFLGIPKFFKEMNLGYRFILRSLSPYSVCGEVVLLGVPN